jgi:N-methylhydantoinase A/oxoprolinase/acetone carboxylase beta subunit
LCADLVQDYLQTYYVPLKKLNLSRVNQIFDQLYQQGIRDIRNLYSEAEGRFYFFVDLRYVGEAFEITVPVNLGTD